MEDEATSCWACQNFAKQFFCSSCACSDESSERASLHRLKAAQLRREDLRRKLLSCLEREEKGRSLRRKLSETGASSNKSKQLAKSSLRRHEQVTLESSTLQGLLLRRKRHLLEAQQSVAKEQAKLLENAPAEAKQKLLHCHLLQETIALHLREQARWLYAALPLRVDLSGLKLQKSKAHVAWQGSCQPLGSGRPLLVSICGLQLPGSMSALPELDRQRLSTALGHLLLLVDILARLLRAPLLHGLHFCGSLSQLWQPRSFHEERKARRAPAHRLYHFAAARVAHPVASQGPPPSRATGLAGNAFAAVRQHWPFDSGFSRAISAAPPRITVSASRQEEDLQAAILQLIRSIGQLCKDSLLNELCLAPHDWPPLAILAGFCMQLAAHPKADGRGNLTASLAVPATQWEVERSILVETPEVDGDSEDEEIDGWDVIRQPLAGSSAVSQTTDALPPRPSEAEAIVHWERAMITDSSDKPTLRARSLQDHVRPLKQGALAAADRLWQGWRR